jgi:two-component system phosphate regulon response regulator PhoB
VAEAARPVVDDFGQPVPTQGEKAHLTPTEAQLWEVLRSQPGRVFHRSELLALVMPDTVVLERTIDVHIKALRQKLGPLGRRIETVRKAGHRFAAEPQQSSGSPG